MCPDTTVGEKLFCDHYLLNGEREQLIEYSLDASYIEVERSIICFSQFQLISTSQASYEFLALDEHLYIKIFWILLASHGRKMRKLVSLCHGARTGVDPPARTNGYLLRSMQATSEERDL